MRLLDSGWVISALFQFYDDKFLPDWPGQTVNYNSFRNVWTYMRSLQQQDSKEAE